MRAYREWLSTQAVVRQFGVASWPVLSSVEVCHRTDIVQELCESRGGRPGLSVLTSLLVSVDVKLY